MGICRRFLWETGACTSYVDVFVGFYGFADLDHGGLVYVYSQSP